MTWSSYHCQCEDLEVVMGDKAIQNINNNRLCVILEGWEVCRADFLELILGYQPGKIRPLNIHHF